MISRRKNLIKLIELWNKAKKGDLVHLIIHSLNKKIRERAWWKLRECDDITLDDLYDLMEGPDFIKKELWEMFIEIATPEDLVDVMNYESFFKELAWKELKQRIRKGGIKKGRSKRILIDIIESIVEHRSEAWKMLKKISPSQTKLKKLLDMPFINAPEYYKLRIDVEKQIRKTQTKKPGNRIAKKIEFLTTKKEQ